jgi:serine/threonine protein kinase
MELSKCRAALIIREWKVMKCVGRHPFVVGLLGAFATNETVYFCSEPMEGGRLSDRLLLRGKYAEVEARSPFRNLASAVAHMHSCNVVHRDIKVCSSYIGNVAFLLVVDSLQ